MTDNKDVIIGEISNSVTRLLGTASAAVLRLAGKKASRTIWPELPTGKTPQEAGQVMSEGISVLGGFGDFAITGVDENNVAKIEFHGCFFASFTEFSGAPCGKQAICHFGFGLVEETYERLTGTKVQVTLVSRDDERGICHETATPRE